MEKETRDIRVLNYIKQYGTITQKEADKYCGTTRLSAAIYNLKKKGYNIVTKMIRVPTRFGWTYVGQYSFNRGEEYD